MHTRKDDALTFDSLRGASRSGGEVDLGIFLKKNSDGVRDGDVYKGTLSLVLEGRETLDIGSRTEAMEVRYAFEPDKFSMEYTGTGVTIGSAAEGKKTREKVYAAIPGDGSWIDRTDIEARCGISRDTARRQLRALEEEGLVEIDESGGRVSSRVRRTQ